MKVACVLTGNLRTFLMPTRENPRERICDLLKRHAVEPNNADVFAFADTNDFYCDGEQIWPETRRIEIINNNSFRMGERVRFATHGEAVELIVTNMKREFGPALKAWTVEPPYDISSDPMYRRMSSLGLKGCVHAMMVAQHRKSRLCHDLLAEWEAAHSTYDVVIKARFDLRAVTPVVAANYNWDKYDIFVPYTKGPLVMDWYAIGTRRAIRDYMLLYDHIGFTADRPTFVSECRKCGHPAYVGSAPPPEPPTCKYCGSRVPVTEDLTGASEHHVYRILTEAGHRIGLSGANWYVYRYRASSANALDAMPDGAAGATLVNYSADNVRRETRPS